MRAYISRRLLLMIPTLLFVTLIVFLLVRFIPGSVLDLMIGEMTGEGAAMSVEEMAALEAQMKARLGLDVPVHIQYGRWLGLLPHPETGFSGLLQGELGNSMWGDWPILEELRHRLPISLELALFALTVAVLLALPVGIFSAIRQDTMGDYAGRGIAIAYMSIPVFWVGTAVTVYPSIWWGWSPAIVYVPLAEDPLTNLGQFLLPAFIQGMHTSGTLMRMTRTMMLEVLRQDYIRTAWSKGLSERTVIYRHALKNALIPVVTQVGNMLPILIGGIVIIETIFNLPGMGELMISALRRRDYPVVSAINVLVASLVLIVNLLVDLSYVWFDPRVVYK